MAIVGVASCGQLKHKAKDTALLNNIRRGNDSVRITSYYLLLDSMKSKTYVAEDLADLTDTINKDAELLMNQMSHISNGKKGNLWMWGNYLYMPRRDALGVLLDIMGYLKDEDSKIILSSVLANSNDNELKMFAAIASIRRGIDVHPEELRSIAADISTRLNLSRSLQDMGRSDLFPAAYNVQDSLALGEMVNWLVYPTELARVPDEISLEKVVTVNEGQGDANYYLFKFRSNDTLWSKDGWMAGVAGPYLLKNMPTPYDEGGTYSEFYKWESMTPQQHIDTLVHVIDNAEATKE